VHRATVETIGKKTNPRVSIGAGFLSSQVKTIQFTQSGNEINTLNHSIKMKKSLASIAVGTAAIFAALAPAEAATTVTFKSSHETTIKVCTYKANDAVQGIPLKVLNIDPGKSASWSGAPKKFHVKVFKPQLIDKLLCSRNSVPYNTTVSISNGNTISWTPKRALVFKNNSDRSMKFMVYNAKDKSMVIGKKQWTIAKGKSVTWIDAPDRFNMKVFQPGILDKVVYTGRGVADRKTVTLTGKPKKFKVSIK
jgi:hypothetical protein